MLFVAAMVALVWCLIGSVTTYYLHTGRVARLQLELELRGVELQRLQAENQLLRSHMLALVQAAGASDRQLQAELERLPVFDMLGPDDDTQPIRRG